VIRGFRHHGLERLFEDGEKARIGADILPKVERVLLVLNAADSPQDLDLPGFGLHPLKGKLQGFWSVAISGNWRLIFRFENGEALDVDLIDYH